MEKAINHVAISLTKQIFFLNRDVQLLYQFGNIQMYYSFIRNFHLAEEIGLYLHLINFFFHSLAIEITTESSMPSELLAERSLLILSSIGYFMFREQSFNMKIEVLLSAQNSSLHSYFIKKLF